MVCTVFDHILFLLNAMELTLKPDFPQAPGEATRQVHF